MFEHLVSFRTNLLVKFNPPQQISSHPLHILHAHIRFILSNILAMSIHIRLETHQPQQHGNHCKLSKHTSMHQLGLKLKMLLIRPSSKNIQHSRHTNPRQNLEGILLPKIRHLVMKRKRITRYNPYTGILHRLLVHGMKFLFKDRIRLHPPYSLFILLMNLFCPFTDLSRVIRLSSHFFHGMAEFHFGSEGKHEERGHDGYSGTALPVGRTEEFLVVHGEVHSGGGWDESDSSGDEAVVHCCRCCFFRSFAWSERRHDDDAILID
mmetsp:Transcript_17564/g.33309  ORF Transcript_17564/g.33309 Transcript_17564/m.33309 type:complete len:265 (-) Transcript_17564:73-867(-)